LNRAPVLIALCIQIGFYFAEKTGLDTPFEAEAVESYLKEVSILYFHAACIAATDNILNATDTRW